MNMQIYSPFAIHTILQQNAQKSIFVKRDKNSPEYLNEPISFDIETTNTYNYKNEKIAFMYIWMLDIYDCTIIGREWAEFIEVINIISNHFQLIGKTKRCIIYIHNLAFEFQFFRKYFEWYKVFATDNRKPLYAITETGIEFRCSLRLSGYRLEKVGENLKNQIPKMVGDLDYTKIRNKKTRLTSEELKYCINDVKIVSEYIREKIADENGIENIPLTKTGYVRRMCKHRTLHGKNYKNYIDLIKELTLTLEEYQTAKRAFMGGFTHANFWYTGKTLDSVTSYDFTSSYPTVMIAEKFPMSKGRKIDNLSRKTFYEYLKEYACIFDIELLNVRPKCLYENYISESKCISCENAIINNGRIYSADRIVVSITNVDFEIIQKCYKFDLGKYDNFYIYELDYLPTEFIKCILDLYRIKTTLKGVTGKEEEYLQGKENLNSTYGMCVTSIIRELIEYDTEWKETAKLDDMEISNQLEKENTKKGRFLFYLWGVFVTAYARKNLWSGILECKQDYVYSDTDSVKILNAENHKKYFDKYNTEIISKLKKALKYHGINESEIEPKTKDGIRKPLGVWDFDGFYNKFKTLGAKRYMTYSEKHGYKMTVAGLSKQKALEYILSKSENPFEFFRHSMYIPPSETGKLTHSYIDNYFAETITDYQGNSCVMSEKSYIHLESAEYRLTLAQVYRDFLDRKREFSHK